MIRRVIPAVGPRLGAHAEEEPIGNVAPITENPRCNPLDRSAHRRACVSDVWDVKVVDSP